MFLAVLDLCGGPSPLRAAAGADALERNLGRTPSGIPPLLQAKSDPRTGQIEVTEAGKPVLRYNYATNDPGALLERVQPENRKYARPRSDYIHPLYTLGGQELTRDWSLDHPHHRGIYWAWPEVDYHGQRGDLHALQRVFSRPTGKIKLQSGSSLAQIDAENLWLWDDREAIVREQVTIRVFPSNAEGRLLDLDLEFTALGDEVAIARRGTDQYGGLNIRLAPIQNQQITFWTEPVAAQSRKAWGDLSGILAQDSSPVGLTVLQNPMNPGYPGDWIKYPELNWFQPTFPAARTRHLLKKGEPLLLRFRLWVHGAKPDARAVSEQWLNYCR
jgi:hypothetical protein